MAKMTTSGVRHHHSETDAVFFQRFFTVSAERGFPGHVNLDIGPGSQMDRLSAYAEASHHVRRRSSFAMVAQLAFVFCIVPSDFALQPPVHNLDMPAPGDVLPL